MPVKASGKDHNGKKFREACETVVVNSHGGLLLLKHEIKDGEMLIWKTLPRRKSWNVASSFWVSLATAVNALASNF